MARFMFIYHDSPEIHSKEMSMSPEDMQGIMEQWNGWIGKGMEEGWMADSGDALKPDGRIMDSNKVISDGPFTESKEIIGGFSIIEAEDYDAACEIAKSCPAFNSGSCRLEVRELAGFGAEVKS